MSSRSQALSHSRAPLSGRAALAALLVLVFLVLAAGPIRRYVEQRGRIDAVEQRIARLEADNQGLRARIDELRDPAVLERIARECLGMVDPGQVAVAQPGQAPAGC